MTLVAVMIAGAAGSIARYVLDGVVQDRVGGVFPWGTFAVNATGSFVLGLVAGLALYHGLPDSPQAIVGAGFCGAYTTFSTFSYESVRLVEEGARFSALMNVLANTAVSLAAAGVGLALAGIS